MTNFLTWDMFRGSCPIISQVHGNVLPMLSIPLIQENPERTNHQQEYKWLVKELAPVIQSNLSCSRYLGFNFTLPRKSLSKLRRETPANPAERSDVWLLVMPTYYGPTISPNCRKGTLNLLQVYSLKKTFLCKYRLATVSFLFHQLVLANDYGRVN